MLANELLVEVLRFLSRDHLDAVELAGLGLRATILAHLNKYPKRVVKLSINEDIRMHRPGVCMYARSGANAEAMLNRALVTNIGIVTSGVNR